MAVIRTEKIKDYTVIDNTVLHDKRLSFRTKGLFASILSLPDDWEYSVSGLAKHYNVSKDAVSAALKELEQYGYLQRRKTTNGGRFGGYQYVFFEGGISPCPEKQDGCPEKPDTGKPPQQNTIQAKHINISRESENLDVIASVVEYLNVKAGTNYRHSSQVTRRHIRARLNEGFSIDDFKRVIDKKCAQWKGGEMEQYLRPQTLFGTKFEQYLNANIVTKEGAVEGGNSKRTNDHITGIVGTWL